MIIVHHDRQYLPSSDKVILKICPQLGYPSKDFYEAQFPFGDELANNVRDFYLLHLINPPGLLLAG